MELLNKQVTPEVAVKIDIAGGKIIAGSVVSTQGVGANVSVSVDVDYFLDELAKKIPGALDDAIIMVLKTALNALP